VVSLLSTLQSLPDAARVDAERALVPLARHAALGALAGDLAHDAANSLFGLRGLLDLVDPEHPLDGERLELLQSAAQDLDTALRPVLHFARADDAPPSDLIAAARHAVSLYRHGVRRSLEIEERYDCDALRVACGPGPLLQAVVHIFLSAEPGQSLDVEVRNGKLRVAPAGAESLDRVLAARIAADAGGSLQVEDGVLVLAIPAAIS
jgi:signal transduction histidine kinase